MRNVLKFGSAQIRKYGNTEMQQQSSQVLTKANALNTSSYHRRLGLSAATTSWYIVHVYPVGKSAINTHTHTHCSYIYAVFLLSLKLAIRIFSNLIWICFCQLTANTRTTTCTCVYVCKCIHMCICLHKFAKIKHTSKGKVKRVAY